MTVEAFAALVARVTRGIAGRPLDAVLAQDLNLRFPGDGVDVAAIAQACRDGIAAGWMCSREAAGIRYGRVLKPGPATDGYSVDVVDMTDVAGPRHRHPNGEIDLVLPLSPAARVMMAPVEGRPGTTAAELASAPRRRSHRPANSR